ncbi:hypothetical protein BJF78_30755 [Pseudonocardia sp. CNS-139]|nr:hypothetical protein BJF78_30755 [Pseudonocardia sp. CNS-139]
MRHWRLLSAVVITVVAVLLASCGAAPGRGPGEAAAPLGPVDPWGSDPAADGPPRRGGTLVLGGVSEAVSFDPTVLNGNSMATASTTR